MAFGDSQPSSGDTAHTSGQRLQYSADVSTPRIVEHAIAVGGGRLTEPGTRMLLGGGAMPSFAHRLSDDEIAAVMAYAPIVERIETLDLSLGTLTDTGAQALLQSPLIPGLKKLDLHHHYCSDAMIQRLWQLPIEVDVRDAQTPDVYDWDGREMVERYVALAE